jgi:hypothetical protein
MGRQAQMMAVLSSIIVHMDDAISSMGDQYNDTSARDWVWVTYK